MLSAVRPAAKAACGVALSAAVLLGTAGPVLAAAPLSGTPISPTTAAAPPSAAPSASGTPSGTTTLGVSVSASASAASGLPAGLYGQSDPTDDGVWRQSLSILALHTQGVTPATSAVAWLTGQQCADGGWPSYNPDPAKACNPATEDTNATSVAVQALTALGGHDDAVTKAVAWYRSVQNKDGGWSHTPGSASDADSTALVVSALAAAKVDPASVAKDGRNALQGLASFQLGCSAPTAQQGAFAFQPDKNGTLTPNDLASAQGALGAEQAFLPVTASTASASASASCSDPGTAAAGYLAAQLKAGQEHLTQQSAGTTSGPDYAATTWAVLALAHQGRLSDAQGAMNWLRQNGQAWTQGDHGRPDPTSLAMLILAAQATGTDATNFGTTNLVTALESTGPTPTATPATPGAASSVSAAPSAAPSGKSGGLPSWLIFVVLLVAGVGIGLFISYNRSKRS